MTVQDRVIITPNEMGKLYQGLRQSGLTWKLLSRPFKEEKLQASISCSTLPDILSACRSNLILAVDSLSGITIWRNSVILWLPPLKGNAPRQHMTCVKTPAPSDFSWRRDLCHCRLMLVNASRYATLPFPSVTMHQRSKIIVILSRLLPRCTHPGYYAAIIIPSACRVECVLQASNDTTGRDAAGVYCAYELSYCLL